MFRLFYAIYLRFWIRTDMFMMDYTWSDAWKISSVVLKRK